MNRSYFGSKPVTGGSGGIGDVVGPSSAVNNNLAAFDGTTGKLIEDAGIATSQVATSQTAADATARLALTGLARGARVYQTDNGFWYELTNPAAPSSAASWQGIPHDYRALLTQSGTDAPAVTAVLENSLGTVSYGYSSAGQYTFTATGLLTVGQTCLLVGNNDMDAQLLSVNAGFLISWDLSIPGAANDIWVNPRTFTILVYP